MAGQPTLVRGTSQTLFGGMSRLSENSVLVLKNKSHAITGLVNWFQFDVDEAEEDADHFVTPEERMRIVMARQ